MLPAMTSSHPSTHILARGGTEQLVLDGAELVVKVGADKGARLALGVGPQRLGSAADCDLVLHDRAVSAHHAEVRATERGYVLRDLGSTNGVLLGRHQVGHVVLADRIKLRLGATTLLVQATAAAQHLPLHGPGVLGELVVRSVAMRAVATELQQYANSELTLLIEGETGTGKEIAARTVHELSARREAPFVIVDLGSIPASLVAAELFGHERGAFTGADQARPGLYEEAEGGTLLLDEVGELPLGVQPLLLRCLEARRGRRIGGRRELPYDVRVVAATNRNLAEEVRAGRFREDLYHRLAVGRLRLPPLRARQEDIVALAQRFADEEGCLLSPELTTVLVGYNWPGNVRELRNTIARVAAIPDDALAELGPQAGVPMSAPGALPALPAARRAAMVAFERDYLETLLSAAEGNLNRAAELAGVSHSLIARLVRRYGRPAR
jgi:DNA-binding NtrC family response regulator